MTGADAKTTRLFVRRGLYAIVDVDALRGRDLLGFASRVLDAGALFAVQLRAKPWSAGEMLPVAAALAARCVSRGVPFFVNDRFDVALGAGATGVHVGQGDLDPRAVRRAAGEALAIGFSTHSLEQALAAPHEVLAYGAIGPVFETRSKERADPVVGVERVRSVVEQVSSLPWVAIGGITIESARSLRAVGVASVAVIAALATAHDDEVTRVARALHEAVGGE